MSNFDGIKITPSEDTKRKLAAYACLTNQRIDEVMGQVEVMLNQFLSEQIIEHAGGSSAIARATPIDKTPRNPADAIQKARPEETTFSVEDDEHPELQHALSDDEDPQENKSLEEQVDEDGALDPDDAKEFTRMFNRKVKDVGDNAEAFLDSAMGEPEERETDEIPSVTRGYAGVGVLGEHPVKAAKSFESRHRKGKGARVSAHTGDED